MDHLSPSVYESIPENSRPILRPAAVDLRLADGRPFPFKGRGIFQIRIGSKSVDHEVWVAEIDVDAILGIEFLRRHRCSLDVIRGTLSWDEACALEQVDSEKPSSEPSEELCRLVLCETVVIAPGAESLLEGEISGEFQGREALVEPAEKFVNKHGLLVAKLLVDPGQEVLPVRLFNPSHEPVRVYKGTVIGVLEEVEEVVGEGESSNGNPTTPTTPIRVVNCTTKDSTDIPSHLIGLMETCGGLDGCQQEQLKELLLKYEDVFSKSPDDLGRTMIVQHTIDTGTAKPIKQPARKVPMHQRETVSILLQEMLDAEVVEPSSSAWSSPVVLVKKKNGKTRFCVDYRKVNGVTVKDSYPIPRITESLDALNGSCWFSTLDLASGYWQVGDGLFQFRTMPFGLCNAPATFERLMDRVLSGLHWQTCLVYLDDVIVYGSTFGESLNRLRVVLERLRKANLKLSPQKCHLFQQSVSYLGYVVSGTGVSTDPEKLKAVREWPQPQKLTHVRSFLGLCGYYRRFVQGFAEIAAPLFKLTEKKQKFDWNKDCEVAFRRLKAALTSAPILAYPDPRIQFIVDTDACDFGVGAVLSQVQDGEERVISYFSKTMTKQEKRYCVTRKELLAVVKAVKQFHHYLYGATFLFEIQHRPGKCHSNADGLSRRPCGDDCSHCKRKEITEEEQSRNELFIPGQRKRAKRPDVEVVDDEMADSKVAAISKVATNDGDLPWLQEWSKKDIRTEQMKDTETKSIIDWKEKESNRPGIDSISQENRELKNYWTQWDRLEIKDGVLYRRWESHDGNKVTYQLVTPRGMREQVIRHLHDKPTAGHMGVKRTLERVQRRFYWHGWRRQVELWTKACVPCQERKQPKFKPKAKMRVEHVGAPLERIAIDILGPLPQTERGNRHIMVVADYFSKWAEAYSIPNQEAEQDFRGNVV
ncbi:Retrovirus-related Pol polyprotein from transposon [Apostichopus japonicus]|uniref:Retrovirus-related Pol polyprotein from transposon n=1 Tax=Stichopus japonicus TaxID=307972 RepID=A0A2G8LDZ4_STIJA|nr:Retrovirus-related Pol polyprotein from transposon [Apostichopus japonicus]